MMSTSIWTEQMASLIYLIWRLYHLAKHDIQFQIGDDLGSDHLPIEISIDAPPHRNSHINYIKYRFDQTDREVFESTLEAALGSEDFSGLASTSDLDKYADFIVSVISTAVDKAIPKSKSVRTENNPISEETLALIKEKRWLRIQFSQIMQVSISSITIPPRTPGICTKNLPPPWGFCILAFAPGGGGNCWDSSRGAGICLLTISAIFWIFHYNGKNWRLTTLWGLFVALKFYVLKENYSVLRLT